jgi:spermidine/putrescine transport system permease protein
VRARLKSFDWSLTEASRDLGATALATFRHVTFPLIWPAVVAAALLAFTLSIDEFIIAYFTAGAGQGSTTLPMQIYAMIRFGVTPEINAMATIILLVSFVLVLLAQRLNRGVPGTQ